MKKNKIGFVGASHLGICSAIAAAEKNFNIILYDTDLKKINDLKKFKIDFYEPDVEKFIKKNKKKILFSNDPKSLKDCEIIYISHDTPTNNSNVSNYNFIENLISKTTKYLNKNSIMVIMCQAYPGFTEKIKWKKEKLFYQVETLIFGKAIQRAINPEQIIIGKSYNCKKKNN